MKKRKPAMREHRTMGDKEAERFVRLASSGPAVEAPYMDHEQSTADVAGAFAAGSIPIDWYIEDQDPERFRVEYGNMLHDPAVKAALLALLFEVCALDINVSPCEGTAADNGDEAEKAAQEVADFVKYALTSAKGGYGRGVLMKIAKPALQHQFSISEIVYKAETKGRWAGKWVLEALKSKDVTNGMWQFRLDAFKNVLAILHMQEGQNRAFETSKFVHYTFMPDFENPRGLSHLRAAYRAWWVKRTVLRAWAVMSEKQGLIPYGSYAADGQKKALEEQLKKFSSRRWLAVPEGVKLDVIRYTTAEAGKAQQDILRDLDKQIFLGIRLAFLQALEGDRTGARSMGEVHEATADLMAWWLSTDLCGVINEQIVPDLVRYNFGDDVGCPTVKLEAAVNEDLEVRSRVDKNLTDMGLPLSKAELYEVYGRKQPKDEEDALEKAAPPPSPFGPGGAPVGPGKPGEPPVPGQGKQGPPPPPKDGQKPPEKGEPPEDKGEGEETVTLSAGDEAWLKRAFGAMDGALNFLAGQAAEADLAFDPDQARDENGRWAAYGAHIEKTTEKGSEWRTKEAQAPWKKFVDEHPKASTIAPPDQVMRAVEGYKSWAFVKINKSLREGNPMPEAQLLVDMARSEKLPAGLTLHRGMSGEKVYKALLNAKEINDRAVMSFTTDKKIANQFSKSQDPKFKVFMTIKTSANTRGLRLPNARESEHLLAPGRLKITNRQVTPKGMFIEAEVTNAA